MRNHQLRAALLADASIALRIHHLVQQDSLGRHAGVRSGAHGAAVAMVTHALVPAARKILGSAPFSEQCDMVRQALYPFDERAACHHKLTALQ